MGIEALNRRPNTSRKQPGRTIYPYLLRTLPMTRGFVYLAAVIDWYSRKVLAWRVSITLGIEFCMAVVEEAIARYGTPEIFNADQGSQFASTAFTGLLRQHGIAISMDGKGCWRDNVFVERLWRSIKYEDIPILNSLQGTEQQLQLAIAGGHWRLGNSTQPRKLLKRLLKAKPALVVSTDNLWSRWAADK